MQKTFKNSSLFIGLFSLLILAFLANLALGNVLIPFGDVCEILLNQNHEKHTWTYIVLDYRFPKAIVAILTGVGLSISGLIMQTLFRNPLAGPYVLGLSSGASLGVAFIILGTGFLPTFISSFFLSNYGLILASSLGSLLVFMAVLLVSKKLKDTMAILIVGLMFGSFTSAIVSVLSYFTSAEKLQKFTFWSMGSISNLSWNEISLLSVFVIIGIGISFMVIKPLNALLLGEKYAQSIGINYKKTRFLIIIATSILAGSITAFAGPIAFIGLAVPHMAKLLFQTSNHFVLFWSTLLLGAIVMLCCDTIAQVPGNDITLPINAITSVIGAPVVIWLLVRKKRF